MHALNVPVQRSSLSELVPALRALVPPLPTVHCTFVVLHVPALTEPFPTDITLVRLLSCVGEEVALVDSVMISVVATLPAAILPSLPHRVHAPPVLLPAVYRTFVMLHVAALDETFPTDIT